MTCRHSAFTLYARRYFYTVFAYTLKSGWSVATWAGVDTIVSAAVNTNIAAYKNAMSTIDAFGAVDGQVDNSFGTTNSADLGGDHLVVTIDLKSKVHAFEAQSNTTPFLATRSHTVFCSEVVLLARH